MGILPLASAELGFYYDSAFVHSFNIKPRTRLMPLAEGATY